MRIDAMTFAMLQNLLMIRIDYNQR